MKTKFLFVLLSLFLCGSISYAQRKTDNLNRGLVAVVPKSGSGIFLSWRVQADEYYDVTYNVYRNGTKLNSETLNVSNYYDASGSASNTYTVKAVVKGVEESAGESAKVFTKRDGGNNTPAYLPIKMKDVVDRDGNVIYSADASVCTWEYTLNDCCMADLDGDGEVEIIVKRINATDAGTKYPNGTDKKLYEYSNTKAYNIFEAYKLDGTRLWWIDCGPNMVSLNSTEVNCVAFDWDQDGKAEVLFRGADNMIVHPSVGDPYYIGDKDVNTRNDIQNHDNAQYAWTITGKEYLVYLEGATAKKYKVIDFPIEREGADKWPGAIDNDSYGHRSSKFFFGAPYLDGRKPSIFLARGIYGRTKMTALDVDANHNLTVRSGWPWECNVKSSPWFGQGYHNYSVADVDGDGCDEIVYGSMVIDNNGKGLSTTGLGHGDAHHVGDLDPYRKGLEIFACNEDSPNMNYRNATTSEIYFRSVGKNDDGRALVGNFSDKFPGCFGRSTNTGMISTVCDVEVPSVGSIGWSNLSDRIYWDGDLLEEYIFSPGVERECVVSKINDNRIMQTYGVKMNNSSKNNSCAQGDILGDWREELVLRSGDNKELRIYTTSDPTEYRIPSLWYDHQYRQAMVWQPCAYNQPPHASFFLGNIEGITQAPPPLTNSGREEITAGSTISTECNGKKMMFVSPTTGNSNFYFTGKISPAELIVNVPTLVSGNDDNNNITYACRTCTFSNKDSNDGIQGDTHFVKQGEGLLVMPKKTLSYTGDTEIWAGSVQFRGKLTESNMWMNRHTSFYGDAEISKSITMEYGATIYPSITATNETAADYATLKVNTLNMHEGSCITIQINTDDPTQHDNIQIGTLNIRKQDWKYGPEHSAPVFNLQGVGTKRLDFGKYEVGTLEQVGDGCDLSDIEVISNAKYNYPGKVVLEDGKIYIVLGEEAETGDVTPHPADAIVVGDEGNNAAWDQDIHSEPYTLTPGQALHIEFRNYNGTHISSVTKEVWENWVLFCKSTSGTEYFAARADNWGWGTKWGNMEVNPAREYNSSAFGSEFCQQLDGAWVVMDIKYEDGEVRVRTTVTSLEGKVMTDSFRGMMISDDEINFYLKVQGSHIAIDKSKTYIKDLGTYSESYRLDFEEPSDNNYGFVVANNASVGAMNQVVRSDGSHFFHIYQGDQNDRIVNLSFENNEAFVEATDYILQFDLGIISNNDHENSAIKINGVNGPIFTIEWIKNSTQATIKDSKGTSLGTMSIDKYNNPNTINIDKTPSVLYRFVISSNSDDGTLLNVKNGNTFIIQNAQLTKDFVTISSFSNEMARYYTHIAYDDIILNSRHAEDVDDGDLNKHYVYDYRLSYILDFEEPSSNKYGFVGDATMGQATLSVGHCFHADQGSGSGDRNANISFVGKSAFEGAEDYKMEFDWGFAVSNQNGSRTSLESKEEGTLFYIETPAYGKSTLFLADGTPVCEIENDGYSKALPTKLSHFVITSNELGTYLTVTRGDKVVAENVMLTTGLVHISALNTKLGRAVSHLALDNITLYENIPFTLSDIVYPQFEPGHYNKVKVQRSLVAGYNTFCIPTYTSPEFVGGEGAKAYTLADASLVGDTYVLRFDRVQDIEPNQPYLLWLPEAKAVPDLQDITLYEINQNNIKEVNGWKFIGSYEAPHNTAGKYLVAGDQIRLGGASSYVYGMRAYLEAPVRNAKVRAAFNDNSATPLESVIVSDGNEGEAIYNVSGIRMREVKTGINIVRKGNGTMYKVYVK